MINPDLPTLASFWIGPYLSWIEQMCLLSFIKHGHRVILYTHGEVKNIPQGVEVRPSQEILDTKVRVFNQTANIRLHPATLYADFFKWHLQKETNHVWLGTDRFCLRPFDLYSRRELEQYGFKGYAFVRYPKDSKAVDLMCRFLKQKHPVPPWFPVKERLRLRWLKLTGRGVPLARMKWGTPGNHLGNWALKQTGERDKLRKIYRFIFEVSANPKHQNRIVRLFEPMAKLDADLKEQEGRKYYILGLGWPVIYDFSDGAFRKFLAHPPEGSWISQQAAELGVTPCDAPVIETREKNRQYLASITGDRSLLLRSEAKT